MLSPLSVLISSSLGRLSKSRIASEALRIQIRDNLLNLDTDAFHRQQDPVAVQPVQRKRDHFKRHIIQVNRLGRDFPSLEEDPQPREARCPTLGIGSLVPFRFDRLTPKH